MSKHKLVLVFESCTPGIRKCFSALVCLGLWPAGENCLMQKLYLHLHHIFLWSLTLMLITGIVGNSSFSLESVMTPCAVSHLAPSMNKPWT